MIVNHANYHDLRSCVRREIIELFEFYLQMERQSEAHTNWSVYSDVSDHPAPQLASRSTIWSDIDTTDRRPVVGQILTYLIVHCLR